ncbi:MAG: extracellular solute-binding protein [Candidatus Ryanbacteria bacterium]|nr:extracellular solute-binding protein [Candidatus Ryanbacteria bacterium]
MKNKVQLIAIIISIIVVIASLIVFSSTGEPQPVGFGNVKEVIIWGVDDPIFFEDAMKDYADQFRKKATYIEKDPRTFDRDLLEAIAAGKSPQAIITSTDWIAKNRDKIAPPQESLIRAEDVEMAFIDLATMALVEHKKFDDKPDEKTVWGLPLWIDPLVLFWNKDLFNQSLVAVPPATWHDFLSTSNKIKELGAGGAVIKSGGALGRARNIPLHKEILALLLLQQGVSLEDALFISDQERDKISLSILRFYTDYGKSGTAAYTWHGTLAEPRELFIEGKLGMMLDHYSYKKELEDKNPHRAFDISPVPQTQGGKLAYVADVRAITVPKGATEHDAAWALARFLVSQPELKKIISKGVVVAARRDLVAVDSLPEILKRSVLNAKSSFEQYPKENAPIIAEMIESIANGQLLPSEATNEARLKRKRLVDAKK